VDAANNIAVAIKDANGSNPMVLLYQIRESLNLLELVVLLPGQDPMAFSYEKRWYRTFVDGLILVLICRLFNSQLLLRALLFTCHKPILLQ
jgi:hypothetical protein